MKDDFGYFGSGLEGYVQYNEAFNRNFESISNPDSIPKADISNMEPDDEDPVEDDSDLYADNDSRDDDEY